MNARYRWRVATQTTPSRVLQLRLAASEFGVRDLGQREHNRVGVVVIGFALRHAAALITNEHNPVTIGSAAPKLIVAIGAKREQQCSDGCIEGAIAIEHKDGSIL